MWIAVVTPRTPSKTPAAPWCFQGVLRAQEGVTLMGGSRILQVDPPDLWIQFPGGGRAIRIPFDRTGALAVGLFEALRFGWAPGRGKHLPRLERLACYEAIHQGLQRHGEAGIPLEALAAALMGGEPYWAPGETPEDGLQRHLHDLRTAGVVACWEGEGTPRWAWVGPDLVPVAKPPASNSEAA